MHLVYYHTRTAPVAASPLVEYYGGDAKWGPYVLYGGLLLGVLLLIGVFLWSRRHAADPPRNEYSPRTIERFKGNVTPNTLQSLNDNDLLPVALTNATEKAKPSQTTESSSQNQGPAMSITVGPKEQSGGKKGRSNNNNDLSTRDRRRIQRKGKR